MQDAMQDACKELESFSPKDNSISEARTWLLMMSEDCLTCEHRGCHMPGVIRMTTALMKELDTVKSNAV